MSEQKQEIKKEVKQENVKLCPSISSFLIEVVRDKLGNQGIGKTRNVSPCIENECKFYDENKKDCKINLFLEGK